MKTVVDTSVLIALLNADDRHSDRASGMLGDASKKGGVFINPVIYSELAAYMDSRQNVDSFLDDTGIKFEALRKQTAFHASQKFDEYLENRGDQIQCPECGEKNSIDCGECGNRLSPRQHIASDFLIGAHAVKQADQLLSFDTDFYSSYFENLEMKELESKE